MNEVSYHHHTRRGALRQNGKRSIMRFTITKKIILPFLLVLGVIILLGGIFLFGYYSISDGIHALEHEMDEQTIVASLRTNLFKLIMDVNDYIITAKEAYREDYRLTKVRLIHDIGELQQLTIEPDEARRLDEVTHSVQKIDEIAQRIFSLHITPSDTMAGRLMEEMDYIHGDRAFAHLQKQYEKVLASMNDARSTMNTTRQRELIIVMIALGAAIVITVVIGVLTHKRISKPLLDLVSIAQRITARDFSIKLKAETEDEIGMLIIAFDAMLQEIKRRYEELENFAYVAAHDLKSPLMGIKGFSEILLSDYASKLDEDGKRSLEIIISSSDRMAALIQDLLSFAKAGQVEFRKEPVPLNQQIEEIEKDLSYFIQQRSAKVVVASDMPSIRCDPIRFSQVWKNLITNALKYNEAKEPAVEIGWMHDPAEKNMYRFFARDNGIGIHADKLDKIFLPFQRVAASAKYEGTGIGLPIVKRVIENHGGRVWVESTYGEGTTFYFTIPKPMHL